MLYIGDYMSIPFDYDKDSMVILNLTSLVEGYQRVFLVPQTGSMLDFTNEDNFDIEYYQYIYSNDIPFMEIMKIIMPLYLGKDVFLLVSRGIDTFDKITESLMKIIQSRYGIVSMLLNDVTDFPSEYDKMEMLNSGFSLSGLSCLDADRERYTFLCEKMKM